MAVGSWVKAFSKKGRKEKGGNDSPSFITTMIRNTYSKHTRCSDIQNESITMMTLSRQLLSRFYVVDDEMKKHHSRLLLSYLHWHKQTVLYMMLSCSAISVYVNIQRFSTLVVHYRLNICMLNIDLFSRFKKTFKYMYILPLMPMYEIISELKKYFNKEFFTWFQLKTITQVFGLFWKGNKSLLGEPHSWPWPKKSNILYIKLRELNQEYCEIFHMKGFKHTACRPRKAQ